MQKLFLIGNAHIDPIWLWSVREGLSEIRATFRSALERISEFDEFIFTSSSAAYYQWIEQVEPEMFAEIARRIREGRWVLCGGWWVQSDCHAPCGESFARQALLAQRYFYEKFGVICTTGYNVDSFGHTGTLPMILSQSGMKNYVFMRPDQQENPRVPYLFTWQAPDGSEVCAYKIPYSYSNHFPQGGPNPLADKVSAQRRLAAQGGQDMMLFYGVGNHGGGPTIANILTLRQLQQQEGGDRLVFSQPNAYFQQVSGEGLPAFRGSLLHHASGCYSAYTQVKQANRQAEGHTLRAEKFISLSRMLTGNGDNSLTDAWREIAFYQFHDMMGGCCIRSALEEGVRSFEYARHVAGRAENLALQTIAAHIHTARGVFPICKDGHWRLWEYDTLGTPLVVYNPHAFPVRTEVSVSGECSAVTDEGGAPRSRQLVRSEYTNGGEKWDTLFQADVPAMGYRVYRLFLHQKKQDPAAAENRIEPAALENAQIRVEIDPVTGAISQIIRKYDNGGMLAAACSVQLVNIEDSDTWAHGIFTFDRAEGCFGNARLAILEQGNVRNILRAVSTYGASTLTQDYILYHDRDTLEVRVTLDFQEKLRMLKMAFPVKLDAPRFTHEIPFGWEEKPADGREQPCQNFIDLQDARLGQGLTVIGDHLFSCDAKRNILRFAAARSAYYADHFAQRDDRMACMDLGEHRFCYTLRPHGREEDFSAAIRLGLCKTQPPQSLLESFHGGSLPEQACAWRVSPAPLAVTAFKRAEAGNGYILRLQEICGRDTQKEVDLAPLSRRFSVQCAARSVVTYHIPDDPELPVRQCDFLE